MRMARAFIASVPMGVVLVAALVVPLTVIPGTFGFESWPTSSRDQVTEQQVRLAPPKVDVVAVRPRQAVPARHPVLVAPARPRPVNPSPNVVALAPAPRRTPLRVSTPAPPRASGPPPAPRARPPRRKAPPPPPPPTPRPSQLPRRSSRKRTPPACLPAERSPLRASWPLKTRRRSRFSSPPLRSPLQSSRHRRCPSNA